jgi:hypothetical protein
MSVGVHLSLSSIYTCAPGKHMRTCDTQIIDPDGPKAAKGARWVCALPALGHGPPLYARWLPRVISSSAVSNRDQSPTSGQAQRAEGLHMAVPECDAWHCMLHAAAHSCAHTIDHCSL